jgi:hypothetical protein
MQILKVDGSTEELNDNSLEVMQQAVGGYIEMVPTNDGRMMVLNEEGKLLNLWRNNKATALAKGVIANSDWIAGDVIIAEFTELQGGDELPEPFKVEGKKHYFEDPWVESKNTWIYDEDEQRLYLLEAEDDDDNNGYECKSIGQARDMMQNYV